MKISPINTFQLYRYNKPDTVSFSSVMTQQEVQRAKAQNIKSGVARADFVWRPDYSYHHPEPKKYKKVDDFLSRSAIPDEKNLEWLKEQGVSDILDLRYAKGGENQYEKKQAEKLGMKYHNIPLDPSNPDKAAVDRIMALIKEIKKEGNKKLHIHCTEGADRTGMITFIYERVNNIGTPEENIIEWHNTGHDFKSYYKLIPFSIDYCRNYED